MLHKGAKVRIALGASLLFLIFCVLVPGSSGFADGPLTAKIKIVPAIWYNSWAAVATQAVNKGDVLCYIGNLSGGHRVSEISVNSILLNGKVRISKNSDTSLTSFPGFSGPVLRVGFNKREALLSLGLKGSVPDGSYLTRRVVVQGWIPDCQCAFYGFAPVIIRGFEQPVALGIHPKSRYETPDAVELSQNYPNPFNPETEISYVLSNACQVDLSVYNLLGRRVRTLVHEFESAGSKHVKWDGKDKYGVSVASGVYFYKITAGEFAESKKMVILK